VGWFKKITLYCDAEACMASTQDRPQRYASDLRNARGDAGEQGWAYRSGKDYCPEHAR